MQYFGAGDYYFWQGVKAGQWLHENWSPDEVCPSFAMDNETTRACQEAWKWGYLFGKEISKEEYIILTTEPDLRDNKKTEEALEIEGAVAGNC